MDIADEPRWSPRVPQWKIRRLYESDASGLLDDDLLVDVGLTLFLRCKDILTIDAARRGSVACPRCDDKGTQTVIPRQKLPAKTWREEVMTCPVCGWHIAWVDYEASFRRKQLNSGGATRFFADYVQAYPAARTPQEKMLAIDQLLHEFHYSYWARPDLPTRPAGVNLIEGNMTAVIALLDELSGVVPLNDEQAAIRLQWARNLEKFRTIDWQTIVTEGRAQRRGGRGKT